MKTNTSSKFSVISLFFGILAAICLLLSGYGYQWNWWELGTAFTWMIPGSAIMGLIATGLGFVAWYARRKSTLKGISKRALTGFLMGIVVLCTVGFWFYQATLYPPIHDISTDINNPPAFKNIVSLRAEAPNDTTYGDQEKANIQRKNYPDIEPLVLNAGYEVAYDRALAAAKQMPWEQIVTSDKQAGLIEAVDKLPWFGFIDDVAIRIDTAETSERTIIDVRSVSRMGRGDIGVNAQRIRDYIHTVEQQ